MKQHEKEIISQNLIAFMESDEELLKKTVIFVGDWILTDASEKCKAYYDIWDLVLKNYMPTSRPILYRSCERRGDKKIASFTGRIDCAQKFSDGESMFLLICNTENPLQFQIGQERGKYEHTFFPLAELVKKESQSPNCKFSDRLIKKAAKEDEYIMRVNLNWMYSCKWYQK